MASDVSIIDYGLGNIFAIRNCLARRGLSTSFARTYEDVRSAKRLILPGVGSFDRAMQLFKQTGMLPALTQRVGDGKTPILGICVGMQMMACGSEEGSEPGLALFNAQVRLLPAQNRTEMADGPKAPRVPHIGWNRVKFEKDNPLSEGVEDPRFYFLHSYYWKSTTDEERLGITNYGITFVSAIGQEFTFGVQFHPEKSHYWGERLLWNFATL